VGMGNFILDSSRSLPKIIHWAGPLSNFV
jgi:hypothetical protein